VPALKLFFVGTIMFRESALQVQGVTSAAFARFLGSDERPGYVASLASVTEHDGTLYVLCFSDDGPDTGQHPISQEELRAAFNPGVDGMSLPSNRTGFRRDTTTTAHRPGSRQLNGSRLRTGRPGERSRAGLHGLSLRQAIRFTFASCYDGFRQP